jgi:hypothetical protein
MADAPLHNRSTFWYIVITIATGLIVGLVVLCFGRYFGPAPPPQTVVVQPTPKEQITSPPAHTPPISYSPEPSRHEPTVNDGTANVSAEDREQIRQFIERWAALFQSGDIEQYRGFYAEHLTRFYQHANVSVEDVIKKQDFQRLENTLRERFAYPISLFDASTSRKYKSITIRNTGSRG